jgi:hypothetical protein
MGTPVHHQFVVHIAPGQAIFNGNVSVLTGKALVIEHISGYFTLPSGQVPIVSVNTSAFQIDQPLATQGGTHFVPVTIYPTVGFNQAILGQATQIHTMIGSQVALTVSRATTSGILDGQVTISGELV